MSDCGSEKPNVPEKTDENTAAVGPSAAMSPYATGGGGVTFERKVAVQYLAHLLLGDGAVEFGEGRRTVSVAFQQAPDYPVDDLVIQAARPEEVEPSLELALGVRRTPNLVLSDEPTQKLIREFVRAVINTPTNGPESRLGLVVAGSQQHARQLGQLASLASSQMNAPGFFTLVHTPSKFDAGIIGRLDQLEKLVGRALQDLGVADPDTALVRLRTWQLLSRLTVLMPRLEPPDETDWAAVENSLIAVARDPSLTGASQLRDRLLALANDYSPLAAQVDSTLLRRDAYAALDPNFRRHQQGWQVLNHLHGGALDPVREEISDSDGVRLRLDRTDAAAGLVATAAEAAAVIVGGESGVGKSALALRSLSTGDPDTMQALCINLRQVPTPTVDFEARLGLPLSTLLYELSAPLRILVIDGADAVTEGMEDTFRYLVNAAAVSEVKVIAVSGMDSMQVVRDILDACFGEGLATYPVGPLTDTELDEIEKTFPELEGLNSNPRSRELLRRLVVVDLLVRGHLGGVPLTDADAMQEVWSGLVRRQERSDRGHPDARESVLLRLADLSLKGGDRLDVIDSLDGTAVTGLRQDGLLHASVENPFMIGPDFAHDEVRRYAVARLLLAERDPAASILRAGAPRWALGAARLACQALLQQPDTAATPLRGRFDTQQTSFDALVEAGHGTRWGDVPSEALITLVDSSGLIRDAWPKLRTNDNAGLRRLARLVGQRHRDDNGVVNLNVVEPIIPLLLGDSEPWKSGEYASNLFREWLQAHVVAGTPAGQPLRILLRERLVRAYSEGDRRLREQQKAEEAARAARTPEDIEREREFMESHQAFSLGIGYGGRRRRQRPEVPRVCRDEVFLELLALLGPDLGDEGKAILLRIARDAPSSLAPAVEQLFTGDALAGYQRGLLAQLTLAYYLDDEADGSSGYSLMEEDGIRDHHIRGGGLYAPLSAWYYGPFIALFSTDFRRGVAVLNRLLNHAALVRARTLARLYNNSPAPGENDSSAYQETFEITGTPLRYVGDEQVWRWYRGTGVGPYPCISALQTLERACDQLVKVGVPIGTLVSLLLDGCENLAMIGLVVGLFVRHLEIADEWLDPYFTEPEIWRYEFRRIVDEGSMLAASSEGIEAPERRKWSLRDAAMFMALKATDERADDLRELGETLIDRARSRIEQQRDADTTGDEGRGSEDIELQLAPVRAWASSLDRSTFQAYETVNGVYVQATPSEEVVQALQRGREDSERAAEDIRLNVRYYLKRDEMRAETIEPHELAADLASARMLLETPSSFSVQRPWDVPALVAAAALDAYLLRRVDVSDDALAFAADTVIRVSEGAAPPGPIEFEGTYFEQGADRSAAGVLPLLLMPSAAPLRAIVDGTNGLAAFRRVSAAGLNLAQAVANEVRLHLARGLDHLWATPCAQEGPCHHQVGWQIACETFRGCALGEWNPDIGRRAIVLLDEPLADALGNTPDDSILPSRLDASIRALAPASTANICVSTSARDLLTALLAAQRRSLLNHENRDLDPRGHHSLVSARALLTLAQHCDDTPLYEHINAYADNAALLCNLLRGLSAAAEETPDRAAAAREIWPSVIRNVLDLHNNGHTAFQDGLYGEMALAVLLPNRTPENAYMYREIRGKPIVWWEPLALESEVELWLATAAGKAHCVDQLIGFLRMLTEEDQARVGLPWASTLVLENPNHIASRSFYVADWLIEERSAAAALGLSTRWQQVVDALVVEGVARLAPYSE